MSDVATQRVNPRLVLGIVFAILATWAVYYSADRFYYGGDADGLISNVRSGLLSIFERTTLGDVGVIALCVVALVAAWQAFKAWLRLPSDLMKILSALAVAAVYAAIVYLFFAGNFTGPYTSAMDTVRSALGGINYTALSNVGLWVVLLFPILTAIRLFFWHVEARERSFAGNIFNDSPTRNIFFELVVFAFVAFCILFFAGTAIENLRNAGIPLGWGFLGETSGLPISFSLIEYEPGVSTYGRVYLVGILNTLLVAGIGIFFATILGFLLGVARLSSNWIVERLATAYVEFMRNVPLLLHIFIWYFAFFLGLVPAPRDGWDFGIFGLFNNRGYSVPTPIWGEGSGIVLIALIVGILFAWLLSRWAHRRQMATGHTFPAFWVGLAAIIGLPLITFFALGMPLTWDFAIMGAFRPTGGTVIPPEFIALTLALATYTAAFIAEIVRAGILGVNKGQTEAAHALGLRQGQNLRLVIVPQALRIIIPPLTSQYLNITKNSSLAVAIAFPELTTVFTGLVLNVTGQAIEIVFLTMLTYLTFSLLISAFMNWYNSRVALVER